MRYCEGCQQLEGDTTECEETGETVCAACLEPIIRVPKHDDSDYEM